MRANPSRFQWVYLWTRREKPLEFLNKIARADGFGAHHPSTVSSIAIIRGFSAAWLKKATCAKRGK
jgi:hypothetical protein